MYRILPILGDVGIGILAVSFLSSWYGRDFSFTLWLLPFAFLPDLDALPELVSRGNVAASKNNIRDHREVLHLPALWLLPAGAWWCYGGYEGAVAFTLLSLHFLHDSTLTGWGIPWLWPLSARRIKFFATGNNEFSLRREDWVRVWRRTHLPYLIEKFGDEDWIKNHYCRLTPTSVAEYSIFGCALVVLSLHLSA